MAKLNNIQKTYILAVEAVKVAREAVEVEMAPYAELLDADETIEQYCNIEMVVRQKHNVSFYENAKLEAEKVLLEWSFGAVKRTPQYKNDPQTRETVDLVISRVFMPKIRAKLIEQALQLDPRS